MPAWLHRTNKTLLRSVASADLPEPIGQYIEEPDLSAVVGQPIKYWQITGNSISLVNQTQRDAIDAVELAKARDALADEIDKPGTWLEHLFLDEINLLRADAGLTLRTVAQLRIDVRKKLNG